MNEERKKILEMVAQGKISVSDAESLLNAIAAKTQSSEPAGDLTQKTALAKVVPKYLRVEVNGKDEKVNIKVPFQLLRAGAKLAAFMPKDAQTKVTSALNEKGISFDLADMKSSNIEELIQHLGDISIDVDGNDEKVRIYCE